MKCINLGLISVWISVLFFCLPSYSNDYSYEPYFQPSLKPYHIYHAVEEGQATIIAQSVLPSETSSRGIILTSFLISASVSVADGNNTLFILPGIYRCSEFADTGLYTEDLDQFHRLRSNQPIMISRCHRLTSEPNNTEKVTILER